jgi:hypothetical protein
MRCETSRVSFLMCPFCVHGLMPTKATRTIRARAPSGSSVPRSLRLCRGLA